MPHPHTLGRASLYGLALMLLARPAIAVPVGTTPDTRPAAPEQRRQWQDFGVAGEFAGSMLSGNANLNNLSLAVSSHANFARQQVFVDGAALFGQAGTTTLVNRWVGSALYAYNALSNLNLYGYLTDLRDESAKLDNRFTAGGGVCLHKILAPDFSLFLVSVGPAWENERYQGGGGATTWRGVFRVNAVRPFAERYEVGLDAFYMPAPLRLADYRLYGEVYGQVALAEHLFLKLTAADEYASVPQAGVVSNDFGVFSSLRAEWGR